MRKEIILSNWLFHKGDIEAKACCKRADLCTKQNRKKAFGTCGV